MTARNMPAIARARSTSPTRCRPICSPRSAPSTRANWSLHPFSPPAYYGLNLSNKTLGSSPALRKALAMAVDRRQLVETLGFGQVGAFGFVPPGTWNYDPQSWAWNGTNDADRIAEAKRLYAQAGFTAASPLHLRLLFNSNPVIRRTAILTAAMWKETLGVDTEFTDEEYKVFLTSRHDKSRWDVARLGWNADFNDASNFLDTFRAHSSNNDPGFENPAFDALVDQAAATSELEKRRHLLESAERVMLDDYPHRPAVLFRLEGAGQALCPRVQAQPIEPHAVQGIDPRCPLIFFITCLGPPAAARPAWWSCLQSFSPSRPKPGSSASRWR